MSSCINSHVLNCSTEGVGSILSMNGLLAEAKVGEDNMTLAIQHDILWLQIPTQLHDQINGARNGGKNQFKIGGKCNTKWREM